MKKVLIITNLKHSSPRVPGFAKYLPEFGWEPVFLVPDPDDAFHYAARIISTGNKGCEAGKRSGGRFRLGEGVGTYLSLKSHLNPEGMVYSFLSSLYWNIYGLVTYPDPEIGWKDPALKKAREIMSEENIHVMLSSSSPVVTHMICHDLKEESGVKWVAEFRDLWSQNHNYLYGPVRHYFDEKLEKKALLNADAIVTVSSSLVDQLYFLHKKENISYVYNGFDPALLGRRGNPGEKFSITYTGQIYPKKQDSNKFLVALKEILDAGSIPAGEIEVSFYGRFDAALEKYIADKQLYGVVKQVGFIEMEEAFNKQKESQVLLLFNWEDKSEPGVFPIKCFEYLAAQRPILATGGHGSDGIEHLLEETGAGVYAPSVESIKEALLNYYREFHNGSSVSYHGNLEIIKNYSHKEMAKKYSQIFDNLFN